MTGLGTRLTATFAAILLSMGLLSACGSSDSASTGSTSTSKESGSDPALVAPLVVSGGGSDQFSTEGGDNSVQEFGEESDEDELQEVAEMVHGFYAARAEGDSASACSYVSESLLEKLRNLAERTTREEKGCVPFLEAFTSPLSDAEWRESTEMDAGSLRIEGEEAFLIYYGEGKNAFAMPLTQEDGEWKVASLSASLLS